MNKLMIACGHISVQKLARNRPRLRRNQIISCIPWPEDLTETNNNDNIYMLIGPYEHIIKTNLKSLVDILQCRCQIIIHYNILMSLASNNQ